MISQEKMNAQVQEVTDKRLKGKLESLILILLWCNQL